MNMEIMRRYRRLLTEKRTLKDNLEDVTRELASLEPQVLDMMSQEGLQHVRLDDKTLYLHRQLWVGVEDGYTREQAADGLVAAGLGEYVSPSFNVSQVSAYFREQARDTDNLELPEGLKLTEKFTVRMRS